MTFDSYNPIATKNVKNFPATGVTISEYECLLFPLSAAYCFSNPGVTRVARYVNIAPDKVLATLSYGQQVFLKENQKTLSGNTWQQRQYLGQYRTICLHKLIDFLEGEYVSSCDRSIGKNTLSDIYTGDIAGTEFAHDPSFVGTSAYVGFASKADYAPNEPWCFRYRRGIWRRASRRGEDTGSHT